jgi:hypothetical protein
LNAESVKLRYLNFPEPVGKCLLFELRTAVVSCRMLEHATDRNNHNGYQFEGKAQTVQKPGRILAAQLKRKVLGGCNVVMYWETFRLEHRLSYTIT